MKTHLWRRYSKSAFAFVVLVITAGCAGAESAAGVALTVLKIFAGLTFAVLVFFPLMASIAAIRAAIRRKRGNREGRNPAP